MIFKTKGSTDPKLLKDIESFWVKYEANIRKKIMILTGISLKNDNIVCYVDSSTTNGYYGGRTITLGVKGGISKDDSLMVITHELFHIYYWKKIKKMGLTKNSPGNESKNEWKIAELAAFLSMGEPCLMKYWPKANLILYPQIKDVYKKVKSYWKNREFDKFLTKSYKIVESN